jgi:hypothetical protein
MCRAQAAGLLQEGALTSGQGTQKLLGHEGGKTTMIYIHVPNRGGRGVLSPAELL